MDTEKFIQQDGEKKMACFRNAFNTDFDTHHIERESEKAVYKFYPSLRILFDKMHCKAIVGQGKGEFIKMQKWEHFPIMVLTDMDTNIIEVDDIVSVCWYGKRGQTEIRFDIVYVIKGDQIIFNYATIR